MAAQKNTPLPSGSKSFRIDWQKNRLFGTVEGKDLILQSAAAILATERYRYTIYSDHYGNELLTSIQQGKEISPEQAKQLVQEALSVDPRILSVENFSFSHAGDEVFLSMTLCTDEGEIHYRSG